MNAGQQFDLISRHFKVVKLYLDASEIPDERMKKDLFGEFDSN